MASIILIKVIKLKRRAYIQMRRQIQLDDFDTSQTYTQLDHNKRVTAKGNEGRKATGINTQEFKMKDITIQTLIRASNKEDFSTQVDQHTIMIQNRNDNASFVQNKQSPTSREQQQNENEENHESQQSEERTKRLIKFLRKVGSLMEEQINEDLPIYQRFGKDEPTLFKRQSRLVSTLQNLDQASEQKLEISDVSWNATGVILAAAYSKPDHEGICSHKSMICLWALLKRNFRPTRPDIIITPNCINCISFHPKKPSVLACGSYTGEVLLYDYSKTQQQLIAKTTMDDYFHRDIITKLSWWPFRPPGKPETNYNLLSLGTDGKILLWEVPNQAIGEQPPTQKSRLLKYPIKGFLMLRKKEGEIIPVSGLAMNQSKINKNFFIIGSQGGSILRATLNPINHYVNSQAKVILDLQPTIKFKNQVYPFLLNIASKNLPQIKNHIESYCTKNKIKQVTDLSIVFQSMPDIVKLYPNPISFAFQPLAFPISSISDNKYGLFIANAYEGYSRIYLETIRNNLQSIQQGYEWGWLNGSHLMAGFINQEWVVVDWTTGTVVWSMAVGEGKIWREQGRQVAVVCERTKVKILQLGDKLTTENDQKHKQVVRKIEELKTE